MIKLTDYITKRLVEYGVKDVFMISGGGAMHLNDSVGKQEGLNYYCSHHEQASAIGAEGYARTNDKLGVVVVTSGPGGTNTVTGVIGQWLDSVPVLYLSGQVKQETTIESCRNIGLRQLGDQEINIVDVVRPVTKFAAIIDDPKKVRYLLEKAIYTATTGRPGPVWLDVPLNIQASLIDESQLNPYIPEKQPLSVDNLDDKINKTIEQLKKSKRPVIICGRGIRLSGKADEFIKLAKKLKIPLLGTFNGFDIVSSDNEFFVGRIGTVGTRAGNFALQNADLVLSIGSRNNIRQISYGWKSYARHAYKIFVDIDKAELEKPTVKPDLAVNADAGIFIEKLAKKIEDENLPDWKEWVQWCVERKIKYPIVLPEYKNIEKLVQPYYFTQTLTECLNKDNTVVAGNGSACVTLFQAGVVHEQQRLFWNSGCASMGYDLPAAIGACIANGKKTTICLAGDGSLMMNLQELQTAVHYNLPLKIFILNNCGYISIKQTQDSFFEGRYVACDKSCGVSFPDFEKLANGFGIKFETIDNHVNLADKIKNVLNHNGPVLCDVKLIPDYKFTPKLSSEKKPDGRMVSKPLEDMYPFLSREEFKNNMLVPEWNEQGD